jgi:hypothetical protein
MRTRVLHSLSDLTTIRKTVSPRSSRESNSHEPRQNTSDVPWFPTVRYAHSILTVLGESCPPLPWHAEVATTTTRKTYRPHARLIDKALTGEAIMPLGAISFNHSTPRRPSRVGYGRRAWQIGS